MESVDKVKETLSNISNNHNRKIVVFGPAQTCMQLSLTPAYIVENDPTMWGQKAHGWVIFPPEKLLEEDKEQLIIIVTSPYYGDISQQLDDMGFVECVHYFYVFNANTKEERGFKEINGVKIGRYTYGYEQYCHPSSTLKSIGSFCSINYSAQFVTNHPTDFISTHPFQYYGKCNGGESVPPIIGFVVAEATDIIGTHSVIIGNDVWIGSNTVILPHVKIGNGAIIGAGAIVNKDVPDYAIMVGAPARVLRYRFSEKQIEILNRVKWWDWDDKKIIKNAKYFTDTEAFFDKFNK